MAIRIYHPEHGYHNVFSRIEYEEHEKRGWGKVIDKVPEPVKPVEIIVEPIEVVPSPAAIITPTYPCDVCGKVFTMKMHLGAHKRKHKE